jgi:hypothetical protein
MSVNFAQLAISAYNAPAAGGWWTDGAKTSLGQMNSDNWPADGNIVKRASGKWTGVFQRRLF